MKKILRMLAGICCIVLVSSSAWAWQRSIDGTANGLDQAHAIAVDGTGDVVGAGFITNSGIGRGDFTVVKLSGVGGEELWRQVINGTATLSLDQVRAVAVDREGNVVAAGDTRNTGTFDDFTVVKLRGKTELIFKNIFRDALAGD